MQVYEIALPLKDNAGRDLNGSHSAFQNFAMIHCDGYTKRPSGEGAWTDTDGKVYYDRMVPYRVLCDSPALSALLADTFQLFPDQKALYVSMVGQGAIVPAPKTKRLPDKATGLDRLGSSSSAPPAPDAKQDARAILAEIEARRLALSSIAWGLSEQLRAYDRGTSSRVALRQAANDAKSAAAEI